jgi:Fe-S-cluster containining protein
MADTGTITSAGFKCEQCGICCRTQKVVILTIADIFRMADRLGMRPGAFYRRYCMKSERFSEQGLLRIYLKTDGGCPFVKDRHCTVHDFKPIVCELSPFCYVESSLAVLKVLGVIVPGCAIDRMPYDTVARGERERLVDMEIEVSITDDYMQENGKFDEKTAQECYGGIKQAQADGGSRAMAYRKLLDESLQRETHYRNDAYYKGSTGMYLGGFYREFREEAGRISREHRGVLVFEPAAVGTMGGDAVAALRDNDFKALRARIEGKGGDVAMKSSMRSGFEYSAVTISIDGKPMAFFYYYIDPARKPSIRHQPGQVPFTFTNSRKESFTFAGKDASGWLN